MANNLDDPAAFTNVPPPGIFISGHFRERFGYSVLRPGGTRDCLITFTLSGEGIYKVGESTLNCKSGDIVILLPGTAHHYAAVEQGVWDFLWAHFVPEPDWGTLLKLPMIEKGLIRMQIEDIAQRARIGQAFERVLFDNRSMAPFHEELSLNSLKEVLLLLAQNNKKAQHKRTDPRVEEVLRILSQQMTEPHSVPKLAAALNISPSRLSHIFKDQVGDSIIETLMKIRLRQAARMLEFTMRPVSDIANDVGFRDPFYFTKQFTSFFGMSPTAYRMQ